SRKRHQQEWNPTVDQEEPESPHIKEEQEELWTSQEANITKFPSTPVPVKSEEYDEENVKSSQLHQRQTEENKEEANKVDCGGLEPASSFYPHRHLQTKANEQIEDCEETEDSDEDQTLNHKPESKLPTNSSTEQRETETDGDDGGGSEPDIILVHMESVKRRTFDSKSLLEEHMDTHTGQKLVVCHKLCGKRFTNSSNLTGHMKVHTGEKPFSCSECGKRFTQSTNLKNHMRLHTGETPFSCVVCQKCFRLKHHLQRHMKIHMRE
uniref:C2H2-type domain-containing protein n=1 Tax=Sphaeramia orbicularis TaxID=375764 RepID=A0A672YHD5_9TELE